VSGGAVQLRGRAERLAGALPALLADAERLAATVLPGLHGRRRAGVGDEFWQYRPALPGDSSRMIDWRRSARSDSRFVREREWQAAQSVMLWVDSSAAMRFSSSRHLPRKDARARLLALATAVLLVRGGERVGLAGEQARPRQGTGQLAYLARVLAARGKASADAAGADDEYGLPDVSGLPNWSRALFLSDFLGDMERIAEALSAAARRGVRGALVQLLDPQEEAFPFEGRIVFESPSAVLRHETLQAGDLRMRYRERLARRKRELAGLARMSGWQYHCHHTDRPAATALLWIHAALERGR